ncbi:MAG TPA: hypothetical protein VG122_19875 [Gemmata sp.]|jgi:hypothetical protein|nr:hypothetical protein [Gemmata sp.]
MAQELKSWPRPHFVPNGGTPLLFYTVFGVFDLTRPLSRSKYRTSGMPEWLDLVSYDRATHPEVFDGYQSGTIWEMLSRDSPLTANEAERAPQCIGLRGEPTDPPTLDYFRDTIGIVMWLLDVGGAVVYDPQMLWLWSAEEWREEVFEAGEVNADRHTAILVSEDVDSLSWYHTRGMRKFGRPDLSIHGVGTKHAEGVTLLIERFVEYQAIGGVIPEGEEVRMKALPPGGVCHHRGNLDDPDFNNVHVEIRWPSGELK